MKFVARYFFKRGLRSVFKDTNPFVCLLIALLLLLAGRASAALYEFKGVYSALDILTNYCEDCFLELPPDFLATSLVLSVNTDKDKEFRKSLVAAARANGWALTANGKRFHAEPLQNVENLVFVSCVTSEPVNVPKYLYSAALKSDSIKCAKIEHEKQRMDSLAAGDLAKQNKLDSLSKIRLPFSAYELKYFSYTKNFTDKLGVEFPAVLADGNLHNKLNIYDDWKIFATRTNDTSFTFRSVSVAFDSTLSVDWGTEEQTLKTAYVTNNGVINNDYEWRKYGLIINLSKDTNKVKLDFVFRDKEQNISVLQGSAAGALGDTLLVKGQYNVQREVNTGVPFLSAIPILRFFFSTTQTLTDIKNFELYLIPNYD